MRTIDLVRPTTVTEVVQESSNVRSFVFVDSNCVKASPGQFVMVWLPGVGEFPMSVCLSYGKHSSSIAVKAMGEGTRSLYECHAGDNIGIRGPYGNSFTVSEDSRRVLLVGGGTGMAPMIVLARHLREEFPRIKTTMVIGARTKQELPFLTRAKRLLGASNVFPTTDDGSFGKKGFAHEQVLDLVKQEDFDAIYSCGPELMMRAVYQIADESKIQVQFSLERIMKCGIGICGSCCIGNVVLCKDGPVLNGGKLAGLTGEFGRLERDKAGLLVRKR